jgi:hypothetical protein
MVKPIPILILSCLIVFGCRKKEVRDVLTYEETTGINPNCYNNLMDFDELGTDCGGECEPCQIDDVPCEITPNEFNYEDGWYTLPIESTAINGPDGENRYEYIAYAEEGRYMSFLFEGKINLANKYTNSGLLYSDEVQIKYRTNAGTNLFCVYGERLYINFEDGHYIFSACELGFSSGLHISFKLTF